CADAIHMDVMHDGEKPSAQVGALPVKVQLGPGALERVLHQVVGAGTVADERTRVATQPWDQLDQALRFIQGEQPSSASYSTLFGLGRQWREAAQVRDQRVKI